MTLKCALPICMLFLRRRHGAQVGEKAQTGGRFIQAAQSQLLVFGGKWVVDFTLRIDVCIKNLHLMWLKRESR